MVFLKNFFTPTFSAIMPLNINHNVSIPDHEIVLVPIRAQGAGGQNVNKVSSAIHLRFDIRNSSLPEVYKERLLAQNDQRITAEGVIVLKAQQFRTQEKNREDALERLAWLIRTFTAVKKKRTPTRPSFASHQRRVEQKTQRSRVKALRRKIEGE